VKRRELVGLLAAAPLAGLEWSPVDVQRAAEAVATLRRRGQAFQPQFFTPHEYQTVRILVDLILPRDERSGSATDAGVPEFMDFIVNDQKGQQTPMRGGLGWLDIECRERFGRDFTDCDDAQRRALLDDIAWPAKARPEMSQGVAFFDRFRDLTATGFWSSKMGVEDLGYMGNTAVPEWKGCPEEQLKRLGVSYGD
jgi:hypothetical protein